MPQEFQCDVLVIGSGPGGATTAMVLAEAGLKVLVLEEGALVSNPPQAYSLQEMNTLYRFGALSLAWGDPKVAYLEGRCVGGASEVNAGLYHRPLPQVLERWAQEFDIQDFGPAQLEPFFKSNEDELGICTMPDGVGPGSRIIQEGSSRLGWRTAEVPRMWDYAANGKAGQRRSMGRSFIPRALAAGAALKPQIKVQRLVVKGRRAQEAQAKGAGEDQEGIRVKFKDVFVCGGAIQTPLLLRRSGLVKNIGEQLRMHPAIRVVARFDSKVSDPTEGVPVVQVAEFKPSLTLGGAYSSTAYLALWLAGRKDFTRLMNAPEQLGIFYALITARGFGKVRPLPWSAEAMVSMRLEDEDLKALGEGLYQLGRMLFAAGARGIFSPIAGDKDFQSPAEMESLKRGLPRRGVDYSTIHLFSSCPLGGDRKRCALDAFGRVRGLDNVYVNDASMLPDTPGSNPQAVIMAMARRNAGHFLKNRR